MSNLFCDLYCEMASLPGYKAFETWANDNSKLDDTVDVTIELNGVPVDPIDVACEPSPCPNPEYEGIWVRNSFGYKAGWRVTWDEIRDEFTQTEIIDNDSIRKYGPGLIPCSMQWSGPGPEWTQIERAQSEAIAGPRLERPRPHGGIVTPIDTGY